MQVTAESCFTNLNEDIVIKAVWPAEGYYDPDFETTLYNEIDENQYTLYHGNYEISLEDLEDLILQEMIAYRIDNDENYPESPAEYYEEFLGRLLYQSDKSVEEELWCGEV